MWPLSTLTLEEDERDDIGTFRGLWNAMVIEVAVVAVIVVLTWACTWHVSPR
jgi:hypothetical protein